MTNRAQAGIPPIRLPDSLTDGIVLLVAHRVEDAEAHLRGEDEEMRRRFDSPRPATLDETRAAMIRWIEARASGGPIFAYALRAPSGLLMGGCELRMRSARSANLSYWLFPPFRGKGHAVRAIRLLCEAARCIEGLARLEIRISPDNASSRRVAEKSGFVETGFVEEKAWTGAISTMILYVRRVATPAPVPIA